MPDHTVIAECDLLCEFIAETLKDSRTEAAAALREKTALVNQAIAALPTDLREALLLFTVEDMSHAEIAATLGCSTKAVEVHIYRARQALKEARTRMAC